MGSRPPMSKRSVLEKLLDDSMVLITLDARYEGVDVPGHLLGDIQLRLNLSHRFGLPLELDELGVHATLTFGGVSHDCHVPWDAIYMIVSHATGQPFIFPSDVPSDFGLAEEAAAEEQETKPALRVIVGEADDDALASEADSAKDSGNFDDEPPRPQSKNGNRGHLRVVK